MHDFTYNEDAREVKLSNGMRCVSIRDPSMEDVAVKLVIHVGFSKDPADLNGLAHISKSLYGCGSSRFPGLDNFGSFISDNEAQFEQETFFDSTHLTSVVPEYALEQYLDRLSDMLMSPDISKEALKHAEDKYGYIYYTALNVDAFREAQVREYLLFGKLYQSRLLFKRKDLLDRIREFVEYYFRPSNMTIYLMGNLPTENMQSSTIHYFESLRDTLPKPPTFMHGPRAVNTDFADSLRNNDETVVAWACSRSDERRLSLSIRLPVGKDRSVSLYLAYLFNMSQPGSLQYRLKCLDLVTEIQTVHMIFSINFEALFLQITPTLKGIKNVFVIMSYIQGYLEKIRRMEPNECLFEQSREYYKCLGALDEPKIKLMHYNSLISVGGEIHDLPYANTPKLFDPSHIRQTFDKLSSKNCHLVSMSSDYAQTTVHPDTDYVLQFSVGKLITEPRADGLMEPLLNKLLISGHRLAVSTSNLRMISKFPIVYHQSISNENFTALKIGIKSSELGKLPLSRQRLYALLLNHQLSLVTLKPICEVNIEVVDGSLNIFLKSFPGSLPSLIALLVEIVSKPLTSELFRKFIELKKEEERLMNLWLCGDDQVKYEPHFQKIINYDLDIEKQMLELEAIKGISDLPRTVHGELVFLFGGNVNYELVALVTSMMDCLHSYGPIETKYEHSSSATDYVSVSSWYRDQYSQSDLFCESFSGDTREIIRRTRGHSLIYRIFDLGLFTHSGWSAVLVFASIVKSSLFRDVPRVNPFGSKIKTEVIRKNDRMWFVVECVGIVSSRKLEDAIWKYILRDIAEILSYVNESVVHDFKLGVLKDLVPMRENTEEEISRVWDSIWPNPYDSQFFKTMQDAIWCLSLPMIWEVYDSFLSRSRQFGTHTVILEPRERSNHILSVFSELELGMMGIYEPPEDPIPNNALQLEQSAYSWRKLTHRICNANSMRDILAEVD